MGGLKISIFMLEGHIIKGTIGMVLGVKDPQNLALDRGSPVGWHR